MADTMSGRPPMALFGAEPKFKEPLRVGQFYWPQWYRYEEAARDIFARRYYTSQRFPGPLVVKLQKRIEDFLGVKHAIPVRNATNGLMIVTHSLGLRGKVIVPSWTSLATVQALLWAKCTPVFCDVEPQSQHMSLASVRSLLQKRDIKAILGVHLWGNALPVAALEELAHEYGVALYYDAAHAFGCTVGERAIGSFGRAEVFSFHAANIVSTGEGGCISTNDDALAAKVRAMRGDHVSAPGVSVQSATARMSEIQAAIGMMMLDDFDQHRRRNEELHRRYQAGMSGLAGIRLLKPDAVTLSNFQNLTLVVDSAQFGLSRDQLLAALHAENVLVSKGFDPPAHSFEWSVAGTHDAERLTNTEAAAQRTLQLPLGALVSSEDVDAICDIIREAHACSDSIKKNLAHAAAV
jgi:dTDP-4-amino-4,6-dideoxygalactose transaminase